jgi:hypothetical protein
MFLLHHRVVWQLAALELGEVQVSNRWKHPSGTSITINADNDVYVLIGQIMICPQSALISGERDRYETADHIVNRHDVLKLDR